MAIELPEEIRNRLAVLQESLKGASRAVKWTRPDQIHITLKFFGELPESSLLPVREAVAELCRKIPPILLSVRGTGAFGSGDRIRVLWVGVEDSTGELVPLQRALDGSLEPLGFPGEGRPFRPHLTLGRLREPTPVPSLAAALRERADFEGGSFTARDLTLFSSTLTPAGPIYRAIQEWPLEATP
jgi:2'-5' RNA ligase